MNIINDPWLFVEYLDGTTTQVSVRQAFTAAEKIRKFVTPCFHKTVMYAYDIPVIQLFVTILQAAYYKPEYEQCQAKNCKLMAFTGHKKTRRASGS